MGRPTTVEGLALPRTCTALLRVRQLRFLFDTLQGEKEKTEESALPPPDHMPLLRLAAAVAAVPAAVDAGRGGSRRGLRGCSICGLRHPASDCPNRTDETATPAAPTKAIAPPPAPAVSQRSTNKRKAGEEARAEEAARQAKKEAARMGRAERAERIAASKPPGVKRPAPSGRGGGGAMAAAAATAGPIRGGPQKWRVIREVQPLAERTVEQTLELPLAFPGRGDYIIRINHCIGGPTTWLVANHVLWQFAAATCSASHQSWCSSKL